MLHGDGRAFVVGSDVTFSWTSLQGPFTRVEIEKCKSGCIMIHNVTDPSITSIKVNGIHTSSAKYKMVFYQNGVAVNEEYFVVEEGMYKTN